MLLFAVNTWTAQSLARLAPRLPAILQPERDRFVDLKPILKCRTTLRLSSFSLVLIKVSGLLSCYHTRRNLQVLNVSMHLRPTGLQWMATLCSKISTSTRYPMPPLGHAGDLRRVDPPKPPALLDSTSLSQARSY